MEKILAVLTMIAGVLGVLFLILTFMVIRKKKILGFLISLLCMLLCLSIAGLFGTIAVATQGYRTLTHEEIAAVVRTEPLGEKMVMAHFEFPDGRQASYKLAGDALYVDAHILKWKPVANILGLHTAYELDRVSGRYADLQDELSKPRTLYAMAHDKPLNLFNLRQRYALLSPLLDAQYGSAAFISADKPAKYEVRVSTTGLLIREAK